MDKTKRTGTDVPLLVYTCDLKVGQSCYWTGNNLINFYTVSGESLYCVMVSYGPLILCIFHASWTVSKFGHSVVKIRFDV